MFQERRKKVVIVYVLYPHILFQVKFAEEHHKPPFFRSSVSNNTDRMILKKPFLGLDMNPGTTSFAGTAMKVR